MAMNVFILWIALELTCVIAFDKYSANIQDSEYLLGKLLDNVIGQLQKDIVKSEIDGGRYDAAAWYRLRMKTSEREPARDDFDGAGAGILNAMPSIRDNEYVQHGPLGGAQFMSGSAVDVVKTLYENGLMKNKNEVKTDFALPAYCNPPNPCPVGYTDEDGCLTDFENTAAFSRDFQESQVCLCDSDHMFDCAKSKTGTIQSIDVYDFIRKLQLDYEHNSLVVKKFHVKKAFNTRRISAHNSNKGIKIGF